MSENSCIAAYCRAFAQRENSCASASAMSRDSWEGKCDEQTTTRIHSQHSALDTGRYFGPSFHRNWFAGHHRHRKVEIFYSPEAVIETMTSPEPVAAQTPKPQPISCANVLPRDKWPGVRPDAASLFEEEKTDWVSPLFLHYSPRQILDELFAPDDLLQVVLPKLRADGEALLNPSPEHGQLLQTHTQFFEDGRAAGAKIPCNSVCKHSIRRSPQACELLAAIRRVGARGL